MIAPIHTFIGKVRAKFSRAEWQIRLFGIERPEPQPTAPGVVIIQIDGFSRKQFENAVDNGNIPFLKNLIENRHYKLHSHYSGLPSSTPAVQAELMYGVKCAVPAFSFLDRKSGRVFRMFNPDDVNEIEDRLKKEGKPLLAGGSSYGNVYSGSADESHFCAPNFELSGLFKKTHLLKTLSLFILNFYSFVRTFVLLFVELFLALYDFLKGNYLRSEILKELKIIPSRVGVSILLRELIVIGTKTDIARGLPIIHMNFLGYDEQTHRRGPSSYFAHWSLKGIDDAVKRVWKAAVNSQSRSYDIWIYSDHGQADVVSYPIKYGKSLEQAVNEVLSEVGQEYGHFPPSIMSRRVGMLKSKWLDRFAPKPPVQNEQKPGVSESMGPVGHIYPSEIIPPDRVDEIAEKLVSEAHIPLVATSRIDGKIDVWTEDGKFLLPDDAETIVGADHPFFEELKTDIPVLCNHPDAGQFVIFGWHKGMDQPMTFPVENGSHAGFHPEETHGFALLPEDTPLPRQQSYLRPTVLRQSAMQILNRTEKDKIQLYWPERPAGTFRIMTYNVHSCIGMDSQHAPERIARIIAHNDPDIVALQELDVGRVRSMGYDQAQLIAYYLNMEHYFHPTVQLEEEQYGDAILSRFPMKLIKAGKLPGLDKQPDLEPRGAIWVQVEVNDIKVNILNTHLGLKWQEKIAQKDALLSKAWLGHPEMKGPVIICGDFNATAASPVYKDIRKHYQDCQKCTDKKPRNTWFGRFPIIRIDHIFASEQFSVEEIIVPSSHLTMIASDHRPVIAELKLKS